MANRYQLKRFKSAEILLAFLLVFSGVILGFSARGFVVNFEKAGFAILSEFQKGVWFVTSSVTGFFTSVKDLSNMKREFRELEEKLKDYEFMQRNNTEIRKENERLREQLGFAQEFQYKNIAAQIIGRDVDNLYSGITISKGTRSGIKKGMPVVAIQNGNVGVVGKIVTVGINTSIVMPLYDAKCNISARVQNTRDVGIASGKGFYDLPLNLQYIRKEIIQELNIGDIIVTSGESDNYMKDIPIGRISKVSVLDYDSSLNIELTPILDFFRLENVFVVDQKKSNDRQKVLRTEDKK